MPTIPPEASTEAVTLEEERATFADDHSNQNTEDKPLEGNVISHEVEASAELALDSTNPAASFDGSELARPADSTTQLEEQEVMLQEQAVTKEIVEEAVSASASSRDDDDDSAPSSLDSQQRPSSILVESQDAPEPDQAAFIVKVETKDNSEQDGDIQEPVRETVESQSLLDSQPSPIQEVADNGASVAAESSPETEGQVATTVTGDDAAEDLGEQMASDLGIERFAPKQQEDVLSVKPDDITCAAQAENDENLTREEFPPTETVNLEDQLVAVAEHVTGAVSTERSDIIDKVLDSDDAREDSPSDAAPDERFSEETFNDKPVEEGYVAQETEKQVSSSFAGEEVDNVLVQFSEPTTAAIHQAANDEKAPIVDVEVKLESPVVSSEMAQISDDIQTDQDSGNRGIEATLEGAQEEQREDTSASPNVFTTDHVPQLDIETAKSYSTDVMDEIQSGIPDRLNVPEIDLTPATPQSGISDHAVNDEFEANNSRSESPLSAKEDLIEKQENNDTEPKFEYETNIETESNLGHQTNQGTDPETGCETRHEADPEANQEAREETDQDTTIKVSAEEKVEKPAATEVRQNEDGSLMTAAESKIASEKEEEISADRLEQAPASVSDVLPGGNVIAAEQSLAEQVKQDPVVKEEDASRAQSESLAAATVDEVVAPVQKKVGPTVGPSTAGTKARPTRAPPSGTGAGAKKPTPASRVAPVSSSASRMAGKPAARPATASKAVPSTTTASRRPVGVGSSAPKTTKAAPTARPTARSTATSSRPMSAPKSGVVGVGVKPAPRPATATRRTPTSTSTVTTTTRTTATSGAAGRTRTTTAARTTTRTTTVSASGTTSRTTTANGVSTANTRKPIANGTAGVRAPLNVRGAPASSSAAATKRTTTAARAPVTGPSSRPASSGSSSTTSSSLAARSSLKSTSSSMGTTGTRPAGPRPRPTPRPAPATSSTSAKRPVAAATAATSRVAGTTKRPATTGPSTRTTGVTSTRPMSSSSTTSRTGTAGATARGTTATGRRTVAATSKATSGVATATATAKSKAKVAPGATSVSAKDKGMTEEQDVQPVITTEGGQEIGEKTETNEEPKAAAADCGGPTQEETASDCVEQQQQQQQEAAPVMESDL